MSSEVVHKSQIILDVYAALPKLPEDQKWGVLRHDPEAQPNSVTIQLSKFKGRGFKMVHSRLAYDMYGNRGVQELAQHLIERLNNACL
jgi:hypothetical protein